MFQCLSTVSAIQPCRKMCQFQAPPRTMAFQRTGCLHNYGRSLMFMGRPTTRGGWSMFVGTRGNEPVFHWRAETMFANERTQSQDGLSHFPVKIVKASFWIWMIINDVSTKKYGTPVRFVLQFQYVIFGRLRQMGFLAFVEHFLDQPWRIWRLGMAGWG